MNETVTNRQIALILFGIIAGYGAMGLSKNMAEESGTAGWIPLLIATVFAIFITYIFTYLGYIHKNKTIYEYSELLVGKVLTILFVAIYIIYFFMFFTLEVRLVSEVIKQTILLQTPVWVLSLIMLLIIFYTLTKGLKVIARVCELYGVIIILFAFSLHILLLTQGKLINLKPFLGSSNIFTYLRSSLKTIIPFLGMEILAVIPFDKKENNRKIFKYTTFMIVVIGLLYIIIVESCISVTGVDSIIYYKDALLASVRRIDIPWLQFFRRLDGIAIIAWIMAVYCTMTLFSYGSVFLISKIVKKFHFNFIALITLVLSFIISSIPKTYNETNKLLDYDGYLGLLTAVVIPVILLIMTKVKKYDKKNQ